MFEIPGYKTQEKIGEGGSSEVFRVFDERSNQLAALKVLHARYSGDQAMRKRLAREAEVIGSLKHPNVVKIYKFGTLDSRFYMVLEFLARGSLSEFDQLTPRQRLKVMVQVSDGVAYIHSLGIVHRDLKPSNIMFAGDRIPRLVDFGISLFSSEDYTRLTHTNMVMGTLSYMSPEQQTSPGDVDKRSDIYSLGAILYEIFTGKKPVGRFDDPSNLIKGFDPRLEACILRCLAHKPTERFQSVEDLQRQLVALWQAGLFEDSDTHSPEEHFDDRIGYWVQKVVHGNSMEREEARIRILNNVLPQDLPELVSISRSSGNDVRLALIPAMARLKDPRCLRFLVELIGDPHFTQVVCAALAEIGDKRAVDVLIKVIKKKPTTVIQPLYPWPG